MYRIVGSYVVLLGIGLVAAAFAAQVYASGVNASIGSRDDELIILSVSCFGSSPGSSSAALNATGSGDIGGTSASLNFNVQVSDECAALIPEISDLLVELGCANAPSQSFGDPGNAFVQSICQDRRGALVNVYGEIARELTRRASGS